MFCLSQLDWTDLEKSWCQVCLQTHWRMCRGKRRRPQDCSSLRGSSPSNCKFLMELMISACMSLITPNTHTPSVERKTGEEYGDPEKGGGKNDKRRKEREKKKKRKGGRGRTPLFGHLGRKHTTAVTQDKEHTLQDGWGSDIKRNFMLCSSMKNNPEKEFSRSSCLCTWKPQDTLDHPTMLPYPFLRTEKQTDRQTDKLGLVGVVFTPISLPLW